MLEQIYFTDEELAEIESGAHDGLDKIAEARNNELEDLERERRRIYGDLDYLKKNKISLLRNNVSSAEEYADDVAKLEKELALVEEKMNVFKESEHGMLKYVLTFSELVKMASKYYKHALDSEKQDIITQVFSELTYFNEDFQLVPKDGFLALFQRHQITEKTQLASGLPSSSGGGIWTRGQCVNSALLYRWATPE